MDDSKDILQGEPPKPHCTLKKRRPYLPLLLSFFLPFCIGGLIILYEHLTEPGINMKVVGDGLMQYFPFLYNFRDKLLAGNSLDYSWTVGMGSGYVSMYAYYLASPLYLLSVLVPTNLLVHYYTLMIVIKLSCAGLFMAWFLRIVYRRNDFYLPVFGLLYAFCAWSSGYYWNLMWLDVFALLPLLVAGTVSLLRDGKFRLYIISLALSLWCNYYVAFFCCIFVLLCFIGFCICKWNGIQIFLRRFARIGICTLIGVFIACVVLIPTLLAMQNTYAATAQEHHLLSLNIVDGASGDVSQYASVWSMLVHQTIPGIIRASRQILNEMLTGNTPVTLRGLPNVFTGFSSVILAVYYLICRKIPKRERLVSLALLGFIFLSFILRSLDYIWHGFHFTNMIPYRFSFLFSFVLVVMAYRAFEHIDALKPKHLFFILPVPILMIANAVMQNAAGLYQLILSLAVLVGMCVWLVLNLDIKRLPAWFLKHKKRIAAILLSLIMLCEMSYNFRNGSKEIGLNPQYLPNGKIAYPHRQEALDALKSNLEEGFYRIETTNPMYVNDAALHGYNGVSAFSSSVNVSTNRLLRDFGIAARPDQNTYSYFESSPLTNTMCGIKYIFDRSGYHRNTDYNRLVASQDQLVLLENESFISAGFMTDTALQGFCSDPEETDVFARQEELFRLATGIEDALYTHCVPDDFKTAGTTVIAQNAENPAHYDYTACAGDTTQDITICFTVDADGLYLYTSELTDGVFRFLDVRVNGELHHTREITTRALFCVGNLQKGDVVEFEFSVDPDSDGVIELDFARQNNEVFDAGHAQLADEPLIVSEYSDGYVRGTVNALSDGLFYTSIPYEPGWTAYVDGQEVSIGQTYDPLEPSVKLTDALICFPLSEGTHTIELTYTAPGLPLGIALSTVGLLSFVVLCIVLRKKFVFFI